MIDGKDKELLERIKKIEADFLIEAGKIAARRDRELGRLLAEYKND